jgi:hypothetical protein
MLPSAQSGWPPIAFICCAWVAKSSANISFRAHFYRPPSSLIASAIPVSASVTEVLGITDEPSGIAGQHRLARGIEITDDLDAEPVLLERHDNRLQRVLIRQRGEAVRVAVVLTAGPP